MKPQRTVLITWVALLGWAALLLILFLFPVLTAQAATPLNYDQGVGGTLGPSQKVEYTFDGKTGDRLTVVANAVGGDIDPFVDLFDPQGKLIGQDDNGGGKDNALLRGVVLTQDGIFKVIVSNVRKDGTGDYALMVRQEMAQGAIINFEGPQIRETYQLSRPWNRTDLRYRVLNTLEGFSTNEIRSAIQAAFKAWADVTPLTFTEVSSGRADITIEFGSIDGPLNVLGQACPPSSPCAGQTQFDAEEPWTLGAASGRREISLLAVLTHEFGHAIGLLHSNDTRALMYAAYSPYNLKPGADDIRGAQRLYGAGTGGVAGPTPVPGQPTDSNGDGQPEVRAKITDERYVNFWDFDAEAGETVTITMNKASGGLDPFLVLLDANNNILAYNDDSSGRDAVLRNIKLPQRGTYTIAATRHQQAQGHTTGDYLLTIQYGVTNAPAAPPPTAANAPSGQVGNVRVGAGQPANSQQNPNLDSVLESGFTESESPNTQTRNATVERSKSYNWSATWCAKDEATLTKNLNDIAVSFAVGNQQVDPKLVTRSAPRNGPNGLRCVDYSVLLSDWTAGQVTLTRTITMRNPVYDGFTIYAPGDYVYQYNVTVNDTGAAF
jgi:hypothetical protein